MGDAGPPTPLLQEEPVANPAVPASQEPVREVHVLVTGFGPFKSFTTNPSWLIASAMATELSALPSTPAKSQDVTKESQQQQRLAPHTPYTSLHQRMMDDTDANVNSEQPLRPPNTIPYKIILHTHPAPVRVAYKTVSSLIPSLIEPPMKTDSARPAPVSPTNEPSTIPIYDYVFHIGLASGRATYTLETLAHRSNYTIPDVDDQTGDEITSTLPEWNSNTTPETLHVGWHTTDVLTRWETEIDRRHAEAESLTLQKQLEQLGQQDEFAEETAGVAGEFDDWFFGCGCGCGFGCGLAREQHAVCGC